MHTKSSLAILAALALASGCTRDGSVGPVDTTADTDSDTTTVPAPATSRIAFARDGHIFTIAPDGSDERQLTTVVQSTRHGPSWSPGGHYILFHRNTEEFVNHDLFKVYADGSAEVQLTTTLTETEFMPAWSPDGEQIVFAATAVGGLQLFVMDVDGSNRVQLTVAPGSSSDPTWTPDGRIAFTGRRDVESDGEIYVMNRDGSGVTPLTSGLGNDRTPNWSRDGARVVFMRDGGVHVMNADGSAVTAVAPGLGSPSWSPDGQKIAFLCAGEGEAAEEICVMNADGSGRVNITNNMMREGQPQWSGILP